MRVCFIYSCNLAYRLLLFRNDHSVGFVRISLGSIFEDFLKVLCLGLDDQ